MPEVFARNSGFDAAQTAQVLKCRTTLAKAGKDGAASLVSAISLAVTGKPGDDDEEDDRSPCGIILRPLRLQHPRRVSPVPARSSADDVRPEIPVESRWACLSLLVDAALLLASPGEESREADANRTLAARIRRLSWS